MLENLFKFPIVMIDGQREEQKEEHSELLGFAKPTSLDLIIGEAECPYDDFISISDRWMPTDESYDRALAKKFDACSVIFMNSGTYVVPWTKEKFKRELTKFAEKVKPDLPQVEYNLVRLTKEELIEQIKNDAGKE